MTDVPTLSGSVTDPFGGFDRGFDVLDAVATIIDGGTDVETLASSALAMDRDDRFDSAVELADAPDVDSAAVVVLLDELVGTVQYETFLRALLADDPADHMLLVAALDIAQEILELVGDDPDAGRLWSSLLALGASLHRARREGRVSDECVRDIALAEYHAYAAVGEPLERHPDTVAPDHIRADLRVYGATLAYAELELPLRTGAALAEEQRDDFADLLDAYGVERRDE